MKYLKSLIFAAASLFAASAMADEPAGYYSTCEGLNGQQLLKALCSKIYPHTNVGYDGLWSVYKTSDVRDDGTLWDIYTTKHWSPNFKQCGNYSLIGDCVNREHSFPKSWWGGGKQEQYADAFHLYPTDGRVNGQRGNFPYGECANGTRLPNNGSVQALGRLGTSTFPGFSGQVFEPDDEYKGDLARSYFYMAACYNNKIAGWTSGNGNQMLAGNSYPVFKTWALNLLLKWHRQDPVSDKEIKRNEAVYARQKNRNPFIDHPELAEYIWGDKKSEAWSANPVTTPELVLPVNGSSLDLGATVAGQSRSVQVRVKGASLPSDVNLAVSGAAFAVSPATVGKSAAQSVDGAVATVTFTPSAAGDFTGTLTVKAGDLMNTVNLTGSCVTTLPAGPVRAIAAESFTAVWSYIGDADAQGNYTLDVRTQGASIAGYPKKVTASREAYTVVDLDPLTTYTYTVASEHYTSTPVSVSTTEPVPFIGLYYDDENRIFAIAGTPSEAAEILMEADYTDPDITISVQSPFELSTDKAAWSRTLALKADADDRFYLRVNSATAGSFSTDIVATAGEYVNDDADFYAKVSSPAGDFLEDFESVTETSTDYAAHTVTGSMGTWALDNACVAPSKEGRNGSLGVRMGKNSNSSITLKDNYTGGLGTVTVWTASWSASEGEYTYRLEYSTDNGETWTASGTATASSDTWGKHDFVVNTHAPARLRVIQTAGKRFLVDDISATAAAGIADAEVPDYHLWDAFCRDSQIVVETRAAAVVARVYSLDGTCIFAGTVAGCVTIPAAPGLYIVAVDDYARRVAVK